MKRFWFVALLGLLSGVAHGAGADIFDAHCAICHQSNAQGLAGMYPPLANSIGSYVALAKGRAYLVQVVSFGLTGPISVHGQTYAGLMQAWPALSDEDVAQVLNYILTNFNAKLIPKNFAPLTAQEVAKYRASNVSIGGLLKQRAELIKSVGAAGS